MTITKVFRVHSGPPAPSNKHPNSSSPSFYLLKHFYQRFKVSDIETFLQVILTIFRKKKKRVTYYNYILNFFKKKILGYNVLNQNKMLFVFHFRASMILLLCLTLTCVHKNIKMNSSQISFNFVFLKHPVFFILMGSTPERDQSKKS